LSRTHLETGFPVAGFGDWPWLVFGVWGGGLERVCDRFYGQLALGLRLRGEVNLRV